MAIRVSNYTVQITTAVANFEMSRPIQDSPDMIKWVAKQTSEVNEGDVTIYLNGECKALHYLGDKPIIPAVWTHCPLPIGMDATALQVKFEERATSVLGDYDSIPCFDVHSPERVGLYTDNRYVHVGIRAAWMMYVDQAIEHFVAK